jgi:putative sugar O-methyltransferase
MLPTKLNYIEDSFHKSVINYQQQYKSKHWRYYNNKKIKLLNKKFIKDFRKNTLHLNLDDKAQNIDSLLSFFNQIIKKVGRNFVEENLDTSNIGNNQHYFKYKSFFVDFNLLHAINFLYEIVTNIALNNNMIICEIGGGYGHLSKLLIKNFKSKILLIDLPETNYLSSYYLMENFKDLDFLLYSNIKSDYVDSNMIKNYDVIIVPPWVKIQNIQLDLFINIRSMMEMNLETINDYFNLIQKSTKKEGYFVNINRYLKNTVGYDVKLGEYPYDNCWSVLSSKKSEFQPHIHQLITKRTEKNDPSISKELTSIENFTKKYKEFCLAGKSKVERRF